MSSQESFRNFANNHKAPIAAIGAAAVLVSTLKFGSGTETDPEHSQVEATVISIEPVVLDCRARTVAEVGAQLQTDLTIMGKAVPGTGLNAYFRNQDNEPGTKGRVMTLTCLENPSAPTPTSIQGSKHRSLVLNTADIREYSIIDEAESRTSTDNPVLSSMGEGISKFIRGVSGGRINTWDSYTEDLKADITAATRELVINTADTKCGAAAWTATQQIIEAAYHEQDPNLDISWSGTKPEFTPTYALDGHDGRYKLNMKDLAVNVCNVSSQVMEGVHTQITSIDGLTARTNRSGDQ